ncbi:OsmC family protein [Pseudomonas brassicacearum]
MSEHVAEIKWEKNAHADDASTYSRNHVSHFDGKQKLNVSASVEYKGDALCADPEQLLVSAAASCHMLFFLAIAEQLGFLPESYCDMPVGYLERRTAVGWRLRELSFIRRLFFPERRGRTRMLLTGCILEHTSGVLLVIQLKPPLRSVIIQSNVKGPAQ